MSKHRILRTSFLSALTILLFSGFFDTTSGLNQKAGEHYKERRYESALDAFRKAQIKSPDNSTIRYNLGTTLYQLDQFQEADTQLERSVANAKTKDLKAEAWYNYGNTQYRLGQFDKAIQAYREALHLNPSDQDAKFNLELLQKQKKIFDIKQDKRDEEQKNKPQPSQSQRQQPQQQGGSGSDQKNQEGQSQSQEKDQQGKPEEQSREPQQAESKEIKGEESKKEEGQEQETEAEPAQEGKESEKKDQKQEEKQGEQPTPAELQGAQPKPGSKDEQSQAARPLLQGQMSKENALRILDALRESEQELQILKRPKQQDADHEPVKDW
ncbi:MAG: tetratricopeptide repeat protein [Candidatus Omnitrophica bacterium]|nr:tetratricopeptide repeat protein [Candidatus Omnitrophota bacterium]